MLFDQVSDIEEVLMLTPTTLPPCLQEDGSSPGQQFPCLWDAAVSGDGQGHSFVIDNATDVPHYVTEVLVDGTILTSDTLPTDQLAHTGIDPLVALVAGLMVAVGALLKVATR